MASVEQMVSELDATQPKAEIVVALPERLTREHLLAVGAHMRDLRATFVNSHDPQEAYAAREEYQEWAKLLRALGYTAPFDNSENQPDEHLTVRERENVPLPLERS